ncbi:MAG: peptide deformylase [Gammaproteobacteria bacterium]|nr:peptide deformylase [Gammaproteobacteria bacterium]
MITLNNNILRSVAVEVSDFSSEYVGILVDDMIDTMRALGGLGLAAPQIGVALRVVVFGYEYSERYPDAESVPLTVLINPKLTLLSTKQIIVSERCLSLPDTRYNVPRYHEIRYSGYDLNGDYIVRSVNGYHARVIQHEYDHLDGILIADRVKNPRALEAYLL